MRHLEVCAECPYSARAVPDAGKTAWASGTGTGSEGRGTGGGEASALSRNWGKDNKNIYKFKPSHWKLNHFYKVGKHVIMKNISLPSNIL